MVRTHTHTYIWQWCARTHTHTYIYMQHQIHESMRRRQRQRWGRRGWNGWGGGGGGVSPVTHYQFWSLLTHNTGFQAETKEHINDKRIRPKSNQKRKLPKTEVKASAISCMPIVLVTEPQKINTNRSTLSTVATYFWLKSLCFIPSPNGCCDVESHRITELCMLSIHSNTDNERYDLGNQAFM